MLRIGHVVAILQRRTGRVVCAQRSGRSENDSPVLRAPNGMLGKNRMQLFDAVRQFLDERR